MTFVYTFLFWLLQQVRYGFIQRVFALCIILLVYCVDCTIAAYISAIILYILSLKLMTKTKIIYLIIEAILKVILGKIWDNLQLSSS